MENIEEQQKVLEIQIKTLSDNVSKNYKLLLEVLKVYAFLEKHKQIKLKYFEDESIK